MRSAKKNHLFDLFLLCLLGAQVTAVVFVVVLTLTLPPSDMAHGTMPFSHPLEFPVMFVVGTVCALLVFPFAAWMLREVDLFPSCVRIVLVAVCAVVLVTPFFNFFAVPSAFVAAIAAMFICRRMYPMPNDPASNKPMQADGPSGRR